MGKIAYYISGLLLALLPVLYVQAQEEGDVATNFTFTDLGGKSISLSDYSGKIVFLFLFGNDCPYCKAVGWDTEWRVNKKYGPDENFQALGLDTWDASSSVTTVTAFKTHTNITYPLLLKAGKVEESYSTTYDRLIVVDSQGKIAFKGKQSASDDLDNAIASIESLLSVLAIGGEYLEGSSFGEVYPNPSRESSVLNYRLKDPGHVRISLMDITGQNIGILKDEWHSSGHFTLQVNTAELPEGIYYLNFENGRRLISRKLAVIR